MNLEHLFYKVIQVPIVKLPKPDTPDPFLADENKKNRKTYTYHIENAPTWRKGRKWDA